MQHLDLSDAALIKELVDITGNDRYPFSARIQLELAMLWLRAVLAGGPLPQPRIKADAEAAGYSWATVRRAKDRLGIVPAKTGFDGGWVWRLPGDRSDE
jgi:hypothetical protein